MNYASMTNFTESQCEFIHGINSSYQCSFAQLTKDCWVEDGLIEYTVNLYCKLPPYLFPLAIVILFLWLGFLFIALAVAADHFFCPSLVVIAKVMRMSDNIAGITLLAFGNGAPDVFSAISAVKNMKNGDEGLVFGALLGAGVFLTTIVVGSIALIKPFKSMERPFLRDIVFYIATSFFVFYICYTRVITLLKSISFIVLYILYVVIVVISRVINQYLKKPNRSVLSSEINDDTRKSYDSITRDNQFQTEHSEDDIFSPAPNIQNSTSERTPLIAREMSFEFNSQFKFFLASISPIDLVEWRKNGILLRILAVFKAPALLVLKLTVPVVNYNSPLHNWNKYLQIIHCIITPVFSLFAANRDFARSYINNVMPVWSLFLIGGVILGILVLMTSRNSKAPLYHPVFAFIGFFAAVLWIKTIADEIVNILQTFGIVFSISTAILGLTFLAWGNSIGDFISDVSMARRGFPKAGLSACFGGPLFNTLLGIGIPFMRATFLNAPSYSIPIEFTSLQLLLFIFLAISLISSLIFLPILKFKINRIYAIYLFILYTTFLIFSILVEKDIVKLPHVL